MDVNIRLGLTNRSGSNLSLRSTSPSVSVFTRRRTHSPCVTPPPGQGRGAAPRFEDTLRRPRPTGGLAAKPRPPSVNVNVSLPDGRVGRLCVSPTSSARQMSHSMALAYGLDKSTRSQLTAVLEDRVMRRQCDEIAQENVPPTKKYNEGGYCAPAVPVPPPAEGGVRSFCTVSMRQIQSLR